MQLSVGQHIFTLNYANSVVNYEDGNPIFHLYISITNNVQNLFENLVTDFFTNFDTLSIIKENADPVLFEGYEVRELVENYSDSVDDIQIHLVKPIFEGSNILNMETALNIPDPDIPEIEYEEGPEQITPAYFSEEEILGPEDDENEGEEE